MTAFHQIRVIATRRCYEEEEATLKAHEKAIIDESVAKEKKEAQA